MTSLAKSTSAAIKMALDGLEFIHSHLGVGKGNNEKFLQASIVSLHFHHQHLWLTSSLRNNTFFTAWSFQGCGCRAKTSAASSQ
jgi:hypothetical protein